MPVRRLQYYIEMLPRLRAEETIQIATAAWIASGSNSKEEQENKSKTLKDLTEQAGIEKPKLTPWQEAVLLAASGVNVNYVKSPKPE